MKLDQVPNSMLAPVLNEESPLHQIMMKSAQHSKNTAASAVKEIYWPEEHYHLHKSSYFQAMSETQKYDVLSELNHKTLSLSYYIEKFGLNYGAKMVLEAESTEEKSLYSLFGADEVKHRLWIEDYLYQRAPESIDFHPLLGALGTCLAEGTHQSMIFSIQVVLEGFGLFHYANLRDACLSAGLKKVFVQILQDEVLHHGMGVSMTQTMKLSQESKNQITELTVLFVKALTEAELVLKAVEKFSGGMTATQKSSFYLETDWNHQILARTERIKGLLKKVGFSGLLEDLELKGAFKITK